MRGEENGCVCMCIFLNYIAQQLQVSKMVQGGVREGEVEVVFEEFMAGFSRLSSEFSPLIPEASWSPTQSV